MTVQDTPFKTGMITGRRWEKIVQIMIDSKEIYLHKGEAITAISIDKEYGIHFKIEQVQCGS